MKRDIRDTHEKEYHQECGSTYLPDGGTKDNVELVIRVMIKKETFLMDTKNMSYLQMNVEDDGDVVTGI